MVYLNCDASGVIQSYREIHEDDTDLLAYHAAEGDRLIPSASGEISGAEYYVNDSDEITSRPAMSLSLSATTITVAGSATLSGVPSGATVAITNEFGQTETLVADGTDIALSATMPGSYTVSISLWPYKEEVLALAITTT